MSLNIEKILSKAVNGSRINPEEALILFEKAPLLEHFDKIIFYVYHDNQELIKTYKIFNFNK